MHLLLQGIVCMQPGLFVLLPLSFVTCGAGWKLLEGGKSRRYRTIERRSGLVAVDPNKACPFVATYLN